MSVKLIKTTVCKQLHHLFYKSKKLLYAAFIYFFILSTDIAYGGVLGLITGFATASALVVLPGLLMWAAVSLFDVSLTYTVFDFYNRIQGEGNILRAIKQIWITTRDMANILIIGSFVYIAIAKILSLEKDFRREVITLISVAILMNFSFFFTLTVIDISNWLTVQIYNATIPAASAPGESYGEIIVSNMRGVEMLTGVSIALEKIGDSLGGIFTLSGEVEDSTLGSIAYFILTLILTLIGALLFFRLAFILIARFVLIFIYLSTSALAFAAMLIPSLNKYWVSWRNGLVYNSVVAPVLLFMLYVITKILEVIGISTINGNNVELGNGFTETVLLFLVGIGLLWGAIRVSTILSNKAADGLGGLGRQINGLLNWTQGLTGRGAFAATGWAGRNTIGRAGEWARNSLTRRVANSNSRLIRSALNSMATSGALKKIATHSYDARQSKATQEFMKQAGMNVGSGIKEGFKKIQEQKKRELDKLNKAQYDAAIEAISAERPARNATESAKNAEEEKLKQQEAKLQEAKDALAKLEQEHQEELNKEAEAEFAQKDAVSQRDKEIENIKAAREQASNVIQESEAQMQAETTEINKIEGDIQAKAQQIKIGMDNGTLALGSPELDTQWQELDRLKKMKKQHEERKEHLEQQTQKAQETLNSTPQDLLRAEQQLKDEQAKLNNLRSKYNKNTEERAGAITRARNRIEKRQNEINETKSTIESYKETLEDYQRRWNEMLTNTRLIRAAASLTPEDRSWLANHGVVMDTNGRVLQAPTLAQLDAMSEKEFKKMNKLLGQQAESTKMLAKAIRDSSMSKKEREEAKQAEKLRKTLAQLADTNNNISSALEGINKK